MTAFIKDYKPGQQISVPNISVELQAARNCVDILSRLGCYLPDIFQEEVNKAVVEAKATCSLGK